MQGCALIAAQDADRVQHVARLLPAAFGHVSRRSGCVWQVGIRIFLVAPVSAKRCRFATARGTRAYMHCLEAIAAAVWSS